MGGHSKRPANSNVADEPPDEGAAEAHDPFLDVSSPKDVLTRLVTYMRDMIPQSIVTSMWVDERRGCLQPGPGWEVFPDRLQRMLVNLPLGEGACGIAARERRIVVIEDTETDPMWVPYRRFTDPLGIRAVWCIPILFSGRLYGIFAICHRTPSRPNRDELRLVRWMAEHAAAALAILQLRERERQLKEANEKLREAQRMARIGTWEADLAAGVSHWSEETCAIFGVTLTEGAVPHHQWFDHIHPADRERVRQAMHGLAEGRQYDIEYRVRRPDGEERIVHSVCHRVISRDGRCRYHGTVQDITERRRLEKRMQWAEAMALLGRTAVRLADEICNPLTTLRGFLQMMLAGETLSPDILQLLVQEVSNIETSVHRLLDLVRPQDPQMDTVQVLVWVREAVEAAKPLAEQLGVRVATDVAGLGETDHGPAVRGDSRRLRQALLNILHNAVEASPPGADVWVRMEATELQGRPAWCVAVHDSGPGIQPDVLMRLEETFYTTKPHCAGIGLAFARHIIAEHGGTLSVASAPQSGTTVTLTLPAWEECICMDGATGPRAGSGMSSAAPAGGFGDGLQTEGALRSSDG
jgi:two-component system NtrC family sensor kinase